MKLNDRSGEILDGRYRLEKLLGEGGIGQVYVGTHVITGRRVAVKFLLDEVADNAEIVRRFYREARAATAVGSKHICEVLDMRPPEQGQPFLVMEYLEGEDLRAVLLRDKRLDIGETVEIFRQVLDGLAAAHDAGIVHRDIKPENVFLVRKDEGPPLIKILDFGVSKYSSGSEDRELTVAGAILGSPHYMSPEQASGVVDLGPSADIYSVGVMLHEVLTGVVPFDAPSFSALVIKIATEPPPDPRAVRPEIPRALSDLVLKAMSREAEARYPSAREMRADLVNVALDDDYERDVPPTLVPTSSSSRTPSHGAGIVPPGGLPLPQDVPGFSTCDHSETSPDPILGASPSSMLPPQGLPVPSFSADEGEYFGGDDEGSDDDEIGITQIAPMMPFEEEFAPTERSNVGQPSIPEASFPSVVKPAPQPVAPAKGVKAQSPRQDKVSAGAPEPPVQKARAVEAAAPAPAPQQAASPATTGDGVQLGLLPDAGLDPAAVPSVILETSNLGLDEPKPAKKLPSKPIVIAGALVLVVVVMIVSMLVFRALLSGGDSSASRGGTTETGPRPAPAPEPTKAPGPSDAPIAAEVLPQPPAPQPTPQAVDAGAPTVPAGDGGAVLAAQDGGGGDGGTTAEGQPATPDAGAVDPAAAALLEPIDPDSVRVVIRVSPPEAAIYVDGRPIEGNPAILTLPNDGRSHEIESWARGYRRQETRFTAYHSREIVLTLEQISPPAGARAP